LFESKQHTAFAVFSIKAEEFRLNNEKREALMFIKCFFSALTIFVSTQAGAIETLVNRPTGPTRGLVVIAPAKKYLMKERLFSGLAEKLAREGYVTVRFNWSQDTLQVPELELQRATRDIHQIVQTARKQFGFGAKETILISKSFSTKALDLSAALAKTHILLTPNCSPDAPFKQVYWNLLNQNDLSLRIIISKEDPYCDVDEISQTLKVLSKLSLLSTTHGDHNFVSSKPSNEPSYEYQDEVIDSIAQKLRFL
jgi:predicted alpha/beta-hydrolase family hydrolase